MYFDILDESIINENTYGIDIGCGTGRWTRFLAPKVRFMEVIDPSKAIFSANKLLSDCNNVRLSIASTDNIPFHDNTFDFAMSIGVLHHIPNTQKAMNDCVRKVKMGGYFYTYLYYSLDNKGFFFKLILYCITPLRYFISRMPSWLKKLTCDIIALLVYMPIIIFGRILKILGLNKWASKLPLSIYHLYILQQFVYLSFQLFSFVKSYYFKFLINSSSNTGV
jgi:ubiquinone/menaquinone biosynthesis C-methylase UbiE